VGPAFSIWSVVYAGLAAHTVWQWLPSVAASPRARAAGWPAAASIALNAAWLLVTQQGWLWTSVGVIVALVLVLGVLVQRLADLGAPSSTAERVVVDGTFGLYLGRVGVAGCANVAATLVAEGVSPSAEVRAPVAVVVLAVAVGVAVLVLARTGAGGPSPPRPGSPSAGSPTPRSHWCAASRRPSRRWPSWLSPPALAACLPEACRTRGSWVPLQGGGRSRPLAAGWRQIAPSRRRVAADRTPSPHQAAMCRHSDRPTRDVPPPRRRRPGGRRGTARQDADQPTLSSASGLVQMTVSLGV
jgi:hypothetical protein